MPSLELFVVAGMFPGDMHRLPWNAMFVCIGQLAGFRRMKSANDKSDFLMTGAANIGWLHGPQMGARTSAVAELRAIEPPMVRHELSPHTVGLAVDITFAEEAAVKLFGASSARVVVIATSSSSLGDGAGTIGKFISDVGADLVVVLDNGPCLGSPQAGPAIHICAQDLSDWFIGCGRSADMQVLFAEASLAVARVTSLGRPFRFGIHRQQKSAGLENARSIKLCAGGH
jgi:hypothetical protein